MNILFKLTLCIGVFGLIVFGSDEEPRIKTNLTKANYTREIEFGCSQRSTKSACWRYCSKSRANWCHTFYSKNGHCFADIDCQDSEVCQGWCAWNSVKGCSRDCNEEKKPSQKKKCPPDQQYWLCQTSYGFGSKSKLATGGKWVSADISNEQVANSSTNTLKFDGNDISSFTVNASEPQSALWYPMGELKLTSTKFCWKFLIKEMPKFSTILVGISDLDRMRPRSEVRGLFWGGNKLTVGSGLLIGNFGPKFQEKDTPAILVNVINGKIRMHTFVNKKPYGLAYDVPETALNGIYPAVKIVGSGLVKIDECERSDLPTDGIFDVQPLEIEGNWTLYTIGTAEFRGSAITLKIVQAYNRDYKQSFKIRMRVISRFGGRLYKNATSNWFAEIDSQISERKEQTNPEVMKYEHMISTHIFSIKNVTVDAANGELILESKDYTSIWKKLKPKQTVVNWNPFPL